MRNTVVLLQNLLAAPFRVGIEKIDAEGVYRLTFPKIACWLFCWFSGDTNDFHNPWKNTKACVPGAMILAGVAGIGSRLVPGYVIASATQLSFIRPTLLGESVLVSLVVIRDGKLLKQLTVRICDEDGREILKEVTVTLSKWKKG